MSSALCVLTLIIPFIAPAVLPGQIRIREVHVEGTHRLKESAVIAASGLHVNTQVARADLDSAAQRLFDTGLFTGVNYRYAPLGKPACTTCTRSKLCSRRPVTPIA
ncbi:MAG: FtsQ-type POTRA domain-containing protein [Acidobacteriota bacterium]|nr:FtsQ-type POTRA domain-containing protein [Acidobacteriota bacterium]